VLAHLVAPGRGWAPAAGGAPSAVAGTVRLSWPPTEDCRVDSPLAAPLPLAVAGGVVAAGVGLALWGRRRHAAGA